MTDPRHEPTTDLDRWFRMFSGTGNGRAAEQMEQAVRAWLDSGIALNQSALAFFQERLRDDLDTGRCLLGCRDPGELAEMQSAWSTRLADSYVREWQALMDIGWSQLRATLPPDEKPVATPRSTLRETGQADHQQTKARAA